MKKSIFLFFAAILCATNAWGAKLFFDCSSVNYPSDGALVAIWSWGGSSSDAWSVFKASGATNIIVADIADGRTGGKIVRFNSSVTTPDWSANQWNSTGDISFPSGKNCIKITKWDGATSGTWSQFQLESQASITPSASSVSVGEEVTFTPALTSNQEYNDVLSTTYSVGAGATITSGKFVATEAGTYTVTATVTYNAQGYTNITKTATATCEIVVSEVAVPHPVTGVTVAPTSVTIKQGATTTLTATVAPSNADDPSVTWSSDNESVATVVNGVVTAVAAGTANITVTTVDGGFTATCAVKVKPLQYTFYAINSAEWPTVAAHYWGGADGGSSWPGADMVKESETINGFDIYSITISSDFINIMFTNQLNGDDKNKKTADLTTEGNDGKYYDIKGAKWYADKAAAEAALATPIPDETVYLINTGNWSKAMIHTWNGVGGTAWPGVEMTPTGETIEGYAVYSYTAKQGGQANLLFQESADVNKTGDLEWEAGKYYAPLKNKWYDTKEAAAEALAAPVEYEYVYLINTNDWAKAHIYTWTPEVAGWPGAEMTKEAEQIAGKEVYSYKVVKGTTFGGMNFNCGSDECKTGDLTWSDGVGKYYAPSTKEWYADAAAAEAGLAAPVVYTYTVVGSSAPLFGETWAPAKAENDMTLVEGTKYELVKTDVTLALAEIKYKVAVNHDWTESYPAKDAVLSITEAGKYTITFTFDSNTKEVNATAELTEAAVVLPTVGVKGAWDGWAATTTLTGDNTSASATVNIATAGIYEFGLDVDGNFLASGATIDKANNSTVVTTNAGNMKLTANVLGDYTFTWTYETNTLTVTYPAGEEVEIAKKYYLIGTFNEWVTADPNYEMTLDGGLYKKEVTFAKDVEFKVNDGADAWLGKDNLGGKTYAELDFTADGNIKMKEEKTFTVIFNPANDLITFEGLTETVTTITYVLMGVNSDWTTGIALTQNPDNADEYVLENQVIFKATDAVKVVTLTNGTATAWCGNVDSYSNATYTGGGEDNIVLEDGIYTFYFKKTDNKIYINQTGYARTATPGSFSTICLPYAGTISGATLFDLSDKDANYVYVVEAGIELVAGKPYVILPTEDKITVTYKNSDYVAAGSYNALYGTYEEMDSDDLDGKYVITGNKYYYVDKVQSAGSTLLANRAYFKLDELSPVPPVLAPGARRIALGTNGQNTATGMENVDASAQPVKTIINGQLYILRGEKMYDAQGKLVK